MDPDPLDRLGGWVGRSEEAEDLVTPRLVEGFRATLDPHLAPVPEGEAPPGLHWCLAPPIAPMAALGPDGHPAKGGFLPPVPLPRRLWAGGELFHVHPLRLGDRVLRRSTVAAVEPKEGRSGPLCFVTVRHEWVSPRGVALRERQDVVYRDAPAAAPPPDRPEPPGPPPPPADLAREVEASPVLLFRYSALTFNSHRIHYDLPHARAAEGVPGLAVHGPLQATLLLNLATALAGGGVPARFAYRGLRPLIAGGPFRVLGARGPDGAVRCRTEDAAGRACMTAEASPAARLDR